MEDNSGIRDVKLFAKLLSTGLFVNFRLWWIVYMLVRSADRRLLLAIAVHTCLMAAMPFVVFSGGLIGAVGCTVIVAVLVNWSANTAGHIHLHCALFTRPAGNRALDMLLSAINGFPQSVWKFRHLQHHADGRSTIAFKNRRQLKIEVGVIALFCAYLCAVDPVAVVCYLGGVVAGLALCAVQGRYEHEGGGKKIQAGISHYGKIYNCLYFNDGFHAEHHRHAHRHWSELPWAQISDAATSAYPPQLRWIPANKSKVA